MHGATAVVLGGSVAGLCSAGVLAPHFDKVVVLERDELPPGAEHRRGVPQSKHPHFVLNSGRRAIGEIFPGFEDALIAAGGLLLMPSMDAAYGEMDGWGARKSSTMTMVYSSRILIERVLRDQVRELPNVEIVEGAAVSGLVTSGGGTVSGHVNGVEYSTANGTTTIDADLVVDALGRGSSVRDWLRSAGWGEVPEKTLDAKVTYTSRWYQLPEDTARPANWWWQHIVLTPTQDTGPHPEQHEYLSNFFPIEGNRAIACMGSWGLDMPRKPDAFVAAAEQLRAPTFAKAMEASTPLTEVHLTRATGNKWRRYDELEHPPLGLVAIGDSACAFNPFYAQGMSSAARSAVILGEHLDRFRSLDTSFVRSFLQAQKLSLDVPWMLAMARDKGYDIAEGTETAPAWQRKIMGAVSWPVFNAITAASREDDYVEQSFTAVFNLDKSLREMATDPRFLFGLVRYKIRHALGRTVVPDGADIRLDPPGTDYSDPANPVEHAADKATMTSRTTTTTAARVTAGQGQD